MAGRGRGGKTSSLTQEQLQTMGCIGKDVPQVQTAPPATFPTLMSKPVTLETTASQNYQILWKEDFLNHMRDSAYYLTRRLDSKITCPRHYSERFADAQENSKIKTKAEFQWQLMPNELQLATKKRRTVAANGDSKIPKKKSKNENIEQRLKVLEEKERTEKDVDMTTKRNSDSENDEEDEEELEPDEEMDDENDYGNNHFDNGEAYNEEDDNLDDGPVY